MKFPFDKVRLIMNPIAGQGKAKKGGAQIAEALAAAGVSVEIRETTARGDAERFAAERFAPGRFTPEGADRDLIIAVGGDGTINEILNGMRDDVPLAVYPMGTGNVLQHELKLPRRPARFLEMLSVAKFRRIDLARARNRRFILMAGVGLDAEVVRTFTETRRGTATKLSYVKPLLGAFMRHKIKDVSVTVDDDTIYDGPASVIITNVRFYAGNLTMGPDAVVNDGLLDVVVFGAENKLEIMQHGLATAMSGHRLLKNVHYRQGKKIRVDSPEPLKVQIDGDPADDTPIEIDILPQALTIVVP